MNNTYKANKVKIQLRAGLWVCSLWGYEGYGNTPSLAYTDWIATTKRVTS
jgi:hypothetical protein